MNSKVFSRERTFSDAISSSSPESLFRARSYAAFQCCLMGDSAPGEIEAEGVAGGSVEWCGLSSGDEVNSTSSWCGACGTVQTSGMFVGVETLDWSGGVCVFVAVFFE